MPRSKSLAAAFIKYMAHGTSPVSLGADYEVNLHTADPGESLANIATYPGYAPVTVPVGPAGWTLCDPASPYADNAEGTAMKNASALIFGEATSSTVQTLTHVSLKSVATGQKVWDGPLQPPPTVTAGMAPRLSAGQLVFREI
ncbi:MAG: phage tail fiber protein [Beijerinckiaceae bacterium]